MQKLKVMTILGTRPEIIRLSRIMEKLDRFVDQCIVHTGQNYDYELNEVFFADLGLREPDHFMGVDTSSLGTTLGGILIETERLIKKIKPDAVLILGDTNSALSAIMARRMKVPIYHMEAGNRCFDQNVPEETNRRLVDHISDFNLVYTEHARRHLIAEGLEHRRIYLCGSPMREVLDHCLENIQNSDILRRLNLNSGQYILASLHREENVDHPGRLRALTESLNAISEHFQKPIVVSTHPRTKKRLMEAGLTGDDEYVSFMKPFGFHNYNHLQMNSFCVISDSGTIAEEASILGFPAITPRSAIERPEGLDVGCISVTGLDKSTMIQAISVITTRFQERVANRQTHPIPFEYTISDTSDRVVNLIVGTSKLSHEWDGIRS